AVPAKAAPIVRYTLASGIWVPAYAGTTRESVAAFSSPTPERLRHLFREILQHAQQRVGRRLAEPADRGIAHGVGELRQQRLVPGPGCHQRGGLLGAGPAGRALAATLVLEEAHQVERHGFHIVLVGENDNRVRPHEAAVLF